jgi:hypothetical protein
VPCSSLISDFGSCTLSGSDVSPKIESSCIRIAVNRHLYL